MMAKDTTQLSLPRFDGRAPDDSTIFLSGSERFEAHFGVAVHVGDTGYAVVQFKVQKVTHSENAGGQLSRVQTLSIKQVGLCSGDEGGPLLHEVRKAMASAAGVEELPFKGDSDSDDDGPDDGDEDNVTPIA